MQVPQNTEQSLCDVSATDLTQSGHCVILVPQNTERSLCDVSAPEHRAVTV